MSFFSYVPKKKLFVISLWLSQQIWLCEGIETLIYIKILSFSILLKVE